MHVTDALPYNMDFFDIAMSFKYASTILLGSGEMVAGTILGKILTMIMGFIMLVFIKLTWEAYTIEFEFNKLQKFAFLVDQRLDFLKELQSMAATFVQHAWRTRRVHMKNGEAGNGGLLDDDDTKLLIKNFLLSDLAYDEALNLDISDAFDTVLSVIELKLDALDKLLGSTNRPAT